MRSGTGRYARPAGEDGHALPGAPGCRAVFYATLGKRVTGRSKVNFRSNQRSGAHSVLGQCHRLWSVPHQGRSLCARCLTRAASASILSSEIVFMWPEMLITAMTAPRWLKLMMLDTS